MVGCDLPTYEQYLKFKLPEAAKFSANLYATYGSTLAGLVVRIKIVQRAVLEYINVSPYILNLMLL